MNTSTVTKLAKTFIAVSLLALGILSAHGQALPQQSNKAQVHATLPNGQGGANAGEEF